jgi:hypothetical protein
MSDVENAVLTRREREDLAALARRRAKVAKADAQQRSAELRADFEEKLAAIYDPQDEAWADLSRDVDDFVRKADAELAERCEARGIPKEFRPSLHARWLSRGENATRERRTELRQVATTRIAALEKRAVAQIERLTVEYETLLLGRTDLSDAARGLLDQMPTPRALMPTLSVAEVEEEQKRLKSENLRLALPHPETYWNRSHEPGEGQ